MRSFIYIQSVTQWFTECRPKTYTMIGSRRYNLPDRRISNATRRIINDSLECFFIIRIHYQTEISNHIFYLFSLVERKSSVNFIRYTSFPKSLFKNTALYIRTIQDSKISISVAILPTQFCNLISYNITLFHIAIRLKHTDRFPLFFL